MAIFKENIIFTRFCLEPEKETNFETLKDLRQN